MPRVVLLQEENHLVGVVPARTLRAARRGVEHAMPLRDLAAPHVVLVRADIQVFDLIAILRRERCRTR